MPFKRQGRKVFVKRNGKWVKKGESKTIAKAKAYLRVLNQKSKDI